MDQLFPKTFIKIIVLISVFLFFPIRYSNSKEARSFRHFYARSITDLQELARFEIEIVRHFTQVYLASELLKHDSKTKRLVETYLLDFYESSGFAHFQDGISTTDIKISHNPICAYRLIRRVKFFLRHLAFRPSFFRIFGYKSREIFHFVWRNDWPSNRDVDQATESIYKILAISHFDFDQFANGFISTVQTNCTLDSISSHAIALQFGKEKDIASKIQWLEVAQEKAKNDRKTSVPFLLLSLRKAISKHNLEFDEETMLELNAKSFDRKILHTPGDVKTAKKIGTINYKAGKGRRKLNTTIYDYWALCSGENFQTEAEKSHLFCWYEFRTHPYLSISPVKMEFLARDPDVVRIYEIIHDKEAEKFIESAISTMLPSVVTKLDYGYERKDDDPYGAKTRTSVNSWLSFSDDENASRRIEEITGLQVLPKPYETSEMLQVASYLFGGVFEPHHDELDEIEADDKRIATFMYYFNVVELGGKTAFPNLGLAATPIKGSALFWYNLFRDGSVDEMLIHGACPVLLGEKWAANKWIRMKAQFLARKCTLKRRERFQIPVNNVYVPVPSLATRMIGKDLQADQRQNK